MIDQGGHATRALVFDAFGKIVCHAESEVTTMQKGDLIVEHDPEQMISSVFFVLDKVYDLLGEAYIHIVDAGIATQRSSFVCWDKTTGTALTPIISWQDRRTVNEINVYDDAKSLIHEKTGLYLNPHYGATKIRWCLDQNTFQQAENLCVGPLASFILFHLLEGKPFKIDPANASRTLLMNYKSLTWDDDLLRLFSISKQFLPSIVDTKSAYGVINYKNHRMPLSICTGDQSAAIFSHGMPESKNLYVNMGTGAFVQQYCEQIPSLGEEKLLASIVCSVQGEKSYVIEGTVNGAAKALDWLKMQAGVDNYSTHLDEWAAEVKSPPIFINGISGVGSPFWVANLKSHFLSAAPVAAQFVGVMESIVFLINSNIISINKVGLKFGCIEISGGLSQSQAICQKLADLTGLVVKRSMEPEATALGVYFLLFGALKRKAKVEFDEFYPNENNELSGRWRRWQAEMKKVL